MSNEVTVHVKYRDVEQTFIGNVNDVWISLNQFFNEMIPAFDIMRRVMLTIDFRKLIEDSEDIITIAPEGPQILINKQKLTSSETLTLHLLASYISYKLGQSSKDTLSKDELQTMLGKNTKITSTRLGELCRDGLATKTFEGDYKLTTLGIRYLQNDVLPKVRAKDSVTHE